MTRNVRRYLEALRSLLIARLAGPLSEDDELRHAEVLEYRWRLLSEIEQQEAEELDAEIDELHPEPLPALEDAPVAPLAQHPTRRAA